jgi:hypothetical protein
MEAESEVGTWSYAKGAQRKQQALPYFVASGIQLGGLLDWVRAQAHHILLLFVYVLRFLATLYGTTQMLTTRAHSPL